MGLFEVMWDIFGYGIIFGLIIMIPLMVFCGFATPETGSHTGYITETGYRGLIWKTHYVKVVDSQISFGGSSQNYWYYGIDESDLTQFRLAQKAQQNKTLITAKYSCSFFRFKWQTSENCMLIGLEGVD